MRDWIKLVEDAEYSGIKLAFDDGMVEMSLNGKKIGWFTVDVTHKAQGCVSIHSSIDHDYRKRGFGKIAYDWVEKWAKSKGMRLIPSDRLSPQAYALWQSRDPSAIADFEMIDWFIDRNGKRHNGLEKLWYSPYAIKKYNLREGVEVHNSTTYYRNPTARQFAELLKKHDLRGIVSDREVYVWDAHKEIHHRACSDLSLPRPDDEEAEDEEGFTPSLPFYAHSHQSRGDWEWEGRENVGNSAYVMVHREDAHEMLACSRFAALARI